ncbi:MAG: nucleotidyltransferase family protein [Syntrophaceae bacterium]|nr:nucleotidyltransferase family protein [Syntrophaceae bacterium]
MITTRNTKKSLTFRRERVFRILKAHLPELRERYGVRGVSLFGSFLRGERHQGSDLDVLVEFDRVPSLFEFIRLERHLSGLLKMKVDLVMKSALKPAIGRRILEEAQPV